MASRRMPFRKQFSGSPWQQGGPSFGGGGAYGQSYGGYSMNDQYAMMSAGYGWGEDRYGSMYGSSGMSQMRSMSYGGPPSRHFVDDRMGGRQGSRGQMQRKRLLQRSPAGAPRSKRPNLGSESRRNRSKPQRRQDSAGSGKGRRDRGSKKDSTADEAANITFDDYETWQSSDEEKETKGDGAQNSEQPAVNGVETSVKTEKTDESDKNKDAKKPLVCHVCTVKCTTSERLRKHMSSRTHRSKMETLLVLHREKKQQALEASTKASQQVENRDSSKEKEKDEKRRNWCTVCEVPFGRSFLAHRRTKEHRRKRIKKYPKCRPCRKGFNSFEAYKEHCAEKEHKLKSAEFHYLKDLPSSDEDEAALTPVKIEETEEESKEKKEETKADKEAVEEKKDEKGDEKKDEGTTEEQKEEKKADSKTDDKKTAKPREPKPIGQLFVCSVHGYYCKLCHKFFQSASVAKGKHCCSVMHNDAFKKGMEKALQDEEERQKALEAQERKEQEEADMAAVEKAAKEDAIKKAVQKLKEAKEKEKEAKDKTGSASEKMETDAGDEKDKAEGAAKEETKGSASEKMETDDATVPNGEKEEMEVSTGQEAKPEASQNPVDEEKPAEAAESDGQGEEEGEEEEKVKEEAASSPATRRGRGRGRSQSRGRGRRR